MLNVKELNKAVKEIGVQNIGWIAEADTDNGEWNCFVGADNGDVFGFDTKEGFREDTSLYWHHYIIRPSIAFKGCKDIILVGRGTAYV